MSEAFELGATKRRFHSSKATRHRLARRALSSSRCGGDTGAGWRPEPASRWASTGRSCCPPLVAAPSPSRRCLCLDAWAQDTRACQEHVTACVGPRPAPQQPGRQCTRLLGSSLPGSLGRPGSAPVRIAHIHHRRQVSHTTREGLARPLASEPPLTCHVIFGATSARTLCACSRPQGRGAVGGRACHQVRSELRARRTTAAASPTRLGWPASRRAGGHPARRALSQGGVPACTAGRKSPGREAESASLRQARPCT